MKHPSLSEGIQGIISLLQELEKMASKETQPFYERPTYIYRGIHRYYDGTETSGDKIKKHTVEDVEEGFIRSGLAVRLLKTSVNNEEAGYIKANYINVLQDMIRDVKRHYPDQYPEAMTDLDILADLQHNGGATCLVDFSKSFLTALWFACSDEDEYDGYIYCYDIMYDMIKNNALIYVKKKDEDKSIDALLTQTLKHTNITSDIESRFLIWEPSTRNSRILRQDSLFVFGLEKFRVCDHGIKVLVIKGEHKKHILYALRLLFNVTYKTIYNDSVGYATSNEKLKIINKLSTDHYQRGTHNMIKGNFESAADLLKLWEGEYYATLEPAMKVELHFSLAVCFKNLFRNDQIHYFENAVIEYKNCIRVIKSLIRQKANTPAFEIDYYFKKACRSYNSIVDILYEAGKHDAAVRMCDEIQKEINQGFLKDYIVKEDNHTRNLQDTICKLTKMELFILNTITDYKQSKTEKSKIKLRATFIRLEADIDKANISDFEKFLLDYYRYVLEVILSKDGEPEGQLNKMLKWRKKMEEKKINYNNYFFWNFRDIKMMIDKMDEKEIRDNAIKRKKYNLQNITAHAISFRDIYEMLSVGRSKEV